jgi:23S rRNA (guanine2445-N2)-methyltransferase / 23S rRNA (guanine2069-N7)-methyltransferase
VLAPGGLIFFSTNAWKFKLDATVQSRYHVHDVSAETLPTDFERSPHIHRCYEVRIR